MTPTAALRFGLLLCLLCHLAGGRALAQTDPPAAPAVPLRAESETLESLTSRLRRMGPERLHASRAVQWERVTLHAPQRPTAQVAKDLGTLFGYLWSVEGGERRVLVPAQRTRSVEQELWRRTLERMAAPLAELARLTRTSPAEYQRLREAGDGQGPAEPLLRENLYFLSRPSSHAALQLYLTLTEAQRLELLSNERLLLPWGNMDPRQQQLARTVARHFEPESPKPGAPAASGGPGIDEWLPQFGLVLNVGMHPVTGAVTSFGAGIGGPLLVCASLERSGVPAPADLLPARFALYEVDRALRSPDYPDLEQQPFPAAFKLPPGGEAPWPEVLRELGRHLSLPLYSDDFAASQTPGARGATEAPLPEGASLAEGLDRLCRRYGRLWWRQDGALFFRSRTWFLERLYEVPPPVLDLLQEKLAARGQLDPEAITALCSLTPRQLQGLSSASGFRRTAEPLRARDSSGARTASDYLQVFTLFNEAQKTKALSPTGLPLAEMQPAQQQAFLRMLAIGRGRGILGQLPTLRFRVEQSAPGRPEGPGGVRTLHLSFTYAENAPVLGRLQLALPPQPPAGSNPADRPAGAPADR